MRYIDALNESGFEIMKDIEKNNTNVFSHQDRLFETYEVRILVDAVLSAKFLTEKQAKSITERLKKLTSTHLAKTLPSPVKYNMAMDHIHHQTKVFIDEIHKAIHRNEVITFKYGKYNIQGDFVFQRDGKDYVYYPYELIWDQGFYYLIGQKDNKEGLSSYRVDRMRDVRRQDNRFKQKENHVSEYLMSTFNMFSGNGEWVEILFRDKELINPIIDRFGLDAWINVINEYEFILKTKVIVGHGFYSWLLGWGKNAKILSPPAVVKEVKGIVNEMNQLFS